MSSPIRLADQSDRAAIESIVDAAYRGYIARNGLVPGPMKDDYGARIAERHAFVLEDDGTVVGVLVLVPDGSTMLLDNVAVHPGCKGRGFGRMLIEFAERTSLEQGCTSIRLYTQQVMMENIALYTRYGYRETHRAVDQGLPRVFMRKMLPPSVGSPG